MKIALDADLRDRLTALRAQHIVRAGRRDETAIDVRAAWLLCDRVLAISETRPRLRVLDLGSGFSTIVLRYFMQALWPSRESWEVWTTDTNWRWLGTTLFELEELGLDTRHMLHHELLMQLPPRLVRGSFDLVFVDLAETSRRIMQIELFQQMRTPHGVVILDDWHMEHYRTQAARGWADYAMRTHEAYGDRHGRYMAEAWMAPFALRDPTEFPSLGQAEG